MLLDVENWRRGGELEEKGEREKLKNAISSNCSDQDFRCFGKIKRYFRIRPVFVPNSLHTLKEHIYYSNADRFSLNSSIYAERHYVW